MARFYGRPWEEQFQAEYHWTLAGLYALEEIERIDGLDREGEAIRGAMFMNHAFVPGGLLNRDQEHFKQKLQRPAHAAHAPVMSDAEVIAFHAELTRGKRPVS